MQPGRTRERIRKTKTFTGCWTCRSRKVKCDEERPTCRRCCKAGVECQGYDVKLHWITDEDDVAPSAIKRQAMIIQCSRLPAFSFDEVEHYLSQIDQQTSEATLGPFTVFVGSNKQQISPGAQQLNDSAAAHAPTTSSSTHNLVSNGYEDYDAGAIEDEVEPDEEVFELSDLETPNNACTPNREDPLQLVLPKTNPGSAFNQDCVEWLLDNYIQNVAGVLQPISHPRNLYRTIYVPSALIGSRELQLFTPNSLRTTINTWNNIAVFYSLLATSAFHIRDVTTYAELDHLACGLRSKAFTYLRKGVEALSVLSSKAEDESRSGQLTSQGYRGATTAMLTLITSDVMDGSMTEFWIHLEAIEKFREDWRPLNGTTNVDISLFTRASFLKTLANTTMVDLEPLSWRDYSKDFSLSFGCNQFPDNYGLEITYGITATLAGYMSQITALSQFMSGVIAANTAIPSTLRKTCSDLSNALTEWSIEDEELTSLQDTSDLDRYLGSLHICAFARALRVYYHVRVEACSESEMIHHVEEVARCLNEIEKLKAKHEQQQGTSTRLTASITWSGFMASCEAEPDHRSSWHHWWTTMLKYRVGNIARLWSVVQEAWTLRDSGVREVPAWLPVLRKTGQRILAV